MSTGLVLRGLREADLDQTAALLASRGDESDAVDLRLVVADGDAGFDGVAVVVDGDRVVSTAALLDETLHLGGVAIPAGQVELVATDPEYEGRGLVRDLMAWAHRRSRDRGHLAQVMIGIPYFYRQFGYSYAIPMHRWRRLATEPAAHPPVADGVTVRRANTAHPPAADGVTVRRATAADIPAMHALQEATRGDGAQLRMPHSAACWRWLVARDGTHQLVASRGGATVGTARLVPPPEAAVLGELAASDPDAALALVAHGRAAAGGERLVVQERPGTVAGDAVEPLLAPPSEVDPKRDWYYARIEDFAALLRHLEPLLVWRLAAAGLADRGHELLISSFRSHVRLTIGQSGITSLTAGGPEQAPGAKGGCGVPPDALPGLVFGPYGALGLEQRLPDCYLGGRRELMAALFPPVGANLLTFYLPA